MKVKVFHSMFLCLSFVWIVTSNGFGQSKFYTTTPRFFDLKTEKSQIKKIKSYIIETSLNKTFRKSQKKQTKADTSKQTYFKNIYSIDLDTYGGGMDGYEDINVIRGNRWKGRSIDWFKENEPNSVTTTPEGHTQLISYRNKMYCSSNGDIDPDICPYTTAELYLFDQHKRIIKAQHLEFVFHPKFSDDDEEEYMAVYPGWEKDVIAFVYTDTLASWTRIWEYNEADQLTFFINDGAGVNFHSQMLGISFAEIGLDYEYDIMPLDIRKYDAENRLIFIQKNHYSHRTRREIEYSSTKEYSKKIAEYKWEKERDTFLLDREKFYNKAGIENKWVYYLRVRSTDSYKVIKKSTRIIWKNPRGTHT